MAEHLGGHQLANRNHKRKVHWVKRSVAINLISIGFNALKTNSSTGILVSLQVQCQYTWAKSFQYSFPS